MRKLCFCFLMVLCSFVLVTTAQHNVESLGIEPLLSSRQNVENLFGAASGECRCIYDTENAVIRVKYALEQCTGTLPGWNVPKDTVLSFSVQLRKPERRSTIESDKALIWLYGHGISRAIDTKSAKVYLQNVNAETELISFYPPSDAAEKRCQGFPKFDLVSLFYDPFVDLDRADQYEVGTALISLSKEAEENGTRRPFVIIYRGVNVPDGEFSEYHRRIEDYVYKFKNLRLVDGGCRKKNTLELFLIPKESPPVVPTPSCVFK